MEGKKKYDQAMLKKELRLHANRNVHQGLRREWDICELCELKSKGVSLIYEAYKICFSDV